MEDKDKREMEESSQESIEKDNRDIGEKVDDLMDEVVGGAQDLLYGPRRGLDKDIPATIEKPSGIRKVDKIATRRNIRKKLFGKKGAIIFLVVFGIVMLIGLIVHYIG